MALLGRLWPLVSLRLNFFTPTKKPTGYATSTQWRRKRLYDAPKTPWQRVQEAGVLTAEQARTVQARITGINPADLTRQINQIQLRLIELSRDKTEAMTEPAPRHGIVGTVDPSTPDNK